MRVVRLATRQRSGRRERQDFAGLRRRRRTPPVLAAEIEFMPTGEGYPRSFTPDVDDKRQYELDGLPAGNYEVTITWAMVDDGVKMHTETFARNVVAGHQRINFQLSGTTGQ